MCMNILQIWSVFQLDLKILIFFSIFFLENSNAQSGTVKHHIQIGRSAFYFNDNPIKIGRSGIGFVNHGIRVYTYAPYIGYTRRFKKSMGLRVSFEEFVAGYCKSGNPCSPKIEEVFFRDFYQLQIDGIKYFSLSNRIEISGLIKAGYRFRGSQSVIVKYVDHGTWIEGVGRTDQIKGLGAGLGLEVKYNFFKKFTFSMKGEYLRFNGTPKKQIGIGALIGYEIRGGGKLR